LTALRAEPPCAEVITSTAKVSNIYYTTIPADASDTLARASA
jgi:hypothetical protein